jgi:hypothetical protein
VLRVCKGQYLLPRVFRGRNVRLAIQRNVRKRITVQELDSPLKNTDKAAKNAEQDGAYEVPVSSRRSLGSRADLSQELNNGDKQTAKTDASKAVRQRALEGAASCTFGELFVLWVD